MTGLRVVLYAEGPGESAGKVTLPAAPGHRLSQAMLGPAHLLVRRSLAHARLAPIDEVTFEGPLRTRRGRLPRGSDLLDRNTLRQILAWPSAQRRPDLAIVLVDCDGQRHRRQQLIQAVEDLPVSKVIGAAREEFEAWLIADHRAVQEVLEATVDAPSPPESMPPGEAKAWLSDVLSRTGKDVMAARRTLAERCDLEAVRRRCRTFERFLNDLRDAP